MSEFTCSNCKYIYNKSIQLPIVGLMGREWCIDCYKDLQNKVRFRTDIFRAKKVYAHAAVSNCL